MKKNRLNLAALAAVTASLLIGAGSTQAGTTISAHWLGRNDPNTPLAPNEVAGVVALPYWANLDSNTFTNHSTPLRDSTGAFTSVVIEYEAQDSWVSDGPDVTPNERMMKGTLKFQGLGGVINFSNLPVSGTYDLYVYVGEDGTGSFGRVFSPGATVAVPINPWPNIFNDTFTEVVPPSTTGNYVHFANYSPNPDGSLQTIVYWDGTTINNGVGICGVQLVQMTGPPFGANTASCAITNQPVNVTNIATTTEGPTATFKVAVSGPHATQWLTNGVPAPGATADSYTTPNLTVAANLMTVQAVVSNNITSLLSSIATNFVSLNTTACAITANPIGTLVVAGSAAPFSVGFAGPFVHFQWIKDGTNILNATNSSLSYVAALADNGSQFKVIVYNNVNTNLSAAAQLSVDANTPPVLTLGFMKDERWENIGGNTGQTGINDLIAKLGTTPTTVFYIPGPNEPQTVPDLDNFGTRISGWVRPDTDGDYDFFVRSDDSSALYFNTTPGTLAAPPPLPSTTTGDTPIAWEYGCCNAFFETNTAHTQTTAAPIHLLGGSLYGFVLLHKEGGGGDFAQCAWRLNVASNQPASTLSTIPPGNCYALASSAGHRFAITQQPQPLTVVQDRPARFITSVTNFPVTDVTPEQWYFGGQPVSGAVGPTWTYPKTFWPADNGKIAFARFYTFNGVVDSSNAVLTVIQDTNAPVPAVTTTTKTGPGSVTIGIGFDEPVNPAGLVPANFSTDAPGAVWDAKTNSLGTYLGPSFEVSSLTPGTTYHVLVKNVADMHGNAIPAAGTNIAFQLGSGAWANTGTPIRPGQVVPVGSNGFDILNGGRQEWGTYDEATIAYVLKTNNFDVKVQVIFAEPGSEWTRVGLMARNDLNVNEDPNDRNLAAGAGPASAYAQTHVNPPQTFASSGVWTPPAGSTAQPGNPTPNNSHEQNERLATGATTQGWGSGVTGTPQWPNVWLRMSRSGTNLFGYRSEDGVAWTAQGSTSLTPQTNVMAVGPFLAIETGNIWSGVAPSGFDVWGAPFDPNFDRLFLAQFRNFGDVAVPPSNLTIGTAGSFVVLTWTSGVLQWATVLGSPTSWSDVPGVSGLSYNLTPTGTQTYFRLRSGP